MKVQLNDREVLVDSSILLKAFLQTELQIQSFDGVAVSVNFEVIPKTLWAGYQLNDGDKVLVIRATAGG